VLKVAKHSKASLYPLALGKFPDLDDKLYGYFLRHNVA